MLNFVSLDPKKVAEEISNQVHSEVESMNTRLSELWESVFSIVRETNGNFTPNQEVELTGFLKKIVELSLTSLKYFEGLYDITKSEFAAENMVACGESGHQAAILLDMLERKI